MKRCSRVTDERDMCVADIMDCSKARAMKNFTGRLLVVTVFDFLVSHTYRSVSELLPSVFPPGHRLSFLYIFDVSAICALDMDVGPCRGRFIRWFYDISTHKCMEFTYGGCRGNNNRFRSFEECHEMCVEHMRTGESKRPVHALFLTFFHGISLSQNRHEFHKVLLGQALRQLCDWKIGVS